MITSPLGNPLADGPPLGGMTYHTGYPLVSQPDDGNGSLCIFVFFPLSLHFALPSLTAFACCQKVYGRYAFLFLASVCLYCGFSDPPFPPISFPPNFLPIALWPRTHPLSPFPPPSSSGQPTDSTPPALICLWFLVSGPSLSWPQERSTGPSSPTPSPEPPSPPLPQRWPLRQTYLPSPRDSVPASGSHTT